LRAWTSFPFLGLSARAIRLKKAPCVFPRSGFHGFLIPSSAPPVVWWNPSPRCVLSLPSSRSLMTPLRCFLLPASPSEVTKVRKGSDLLSQAPFVCKPAPSVLEDLYLPDGSFFIFYEKKPRTRRREAPPYVTPPFSPLGRTSPSVSSFAQRRSPRGLFDGNQVPLCAQTPPLKRPFYREFLRFAKTFPQTRYVTTRRYCYPLPLLDGRNLSLWRKRLAVYFPLFAHSLLLPPFLMSL